MKKLIALIAGTAVMLSMTMTSFASFDTVIEANEDGVTYTAALTGDAATANAGKQTTIVAYKGDTIEVGSIQYINQDAATSFTFQLKDELTEDVKVVMGGEAIAKQEIGTIKYAAAPTTVALSGSITSTNSADLTGTVNIYAGTDTTVAPAYTATINVDGTYEIEGGVEPGSYTFEIVKPAHITYTSALTVSEAKEIAAIEMLSGDTTGDGNIAVGDFTPIGNAYNSVAGTDDYVAAADTNGDGSIGVGDFTAVGNNYNATAANYAAIQ